MLAASVTGQSCPAIFAPTPFPGSDGYVSVMQPWNPDPANGDRRLVMAGSYTKIGGVVARSLVSYLPEFDLWWPLGDVAQGNETVTAAAVLQDNSLVVAGSFGQIGGVPIAGIGRLDLAGWTNIGVGLNAQIRALAVMPNGNLVAGGDIYQIGGANLDGVAVWNGAVWAHMGGQLAYSVDSLAVSANGQVFAAGRFRPAPGAFPPTSEIAQWNGVDWVVLTAGMIPPGTATSTRKVMALPNGDMVGLWVNSSTSPFSIVRQWNGNVWTDIGTFNGPVSDVSVANGQLHASGDFTTVNGVAAKNVAQWNGTTWAALGAGLHARVRSFSAAATGDLYAGGDGVLGRWNTTTWSPLGRGANSQVTASKRLANGDLVLAGSFTAIGLSSFALANLTVARGNGTSWSQLGTIPYGEVHAFEELTNGDIVAGGTFTGGHNVLRWTGSAWTTMGAGVGTFFNSVDALLVLPNGDLIAGGYFINSGAATVRAVARWDGTTWTQVGTNVWDVNARVRALAVMPNGDLIAAGGFSQAGGVNANSIARWDGSTWAPLGNGLAGVYALAVMPDGSLVAGGSFVDAGASLYRIARWDGQTWSLFHGGIFDGIVTEIAPLPSGNAVIGGTFSAKLSCSANSSWQPMAPGLNGDVRTLARVEGDEVFVGGTFNSANTVAAGYVGLVKSSCPASTAPFGVGCASSGGSNTLTAVNLPWLGTTFVARATGLPTNAFAIAVSAQHAAAPPVDLSQLFLEGVPGCNLLVNLDTLGFVPIANQTADSLLAMPTSLSFIGQSFHHQLIVFELDSAGGWLAITATNAVQATFGFL